MPSVGRFVHYATDLVLVSTILAGVKRTTGITPKTESIEQEQIRSGFEKYLRMGEYCYDYSIAAFSSSGYFTRR